VDAVAQQIRERRVDGSLPGDAAQASEPIADDVDGEVALAGSVMARMTAMFFAVVDDGQFGRCKGVAEAAGDFCGDGACGKLGHLAYIGSRWDKRRALNEDFERRRPRTRFHGRIEDSGRGCDHPGCAEAGEFRAPAHGRRRPGFDGPGEWRYLCLDHVRAFNSGYNFFDGMSTEEIEAQQTPYAGWDRETRAFSPGAGGTPRWADFVDPLDAIGAKYARAVDRERRDGRPLSDGDRRALNILGLGHDADRRALRARYAELVRRYHPDRNGGDRSHEKALQDVISAYTQLKGRPAFA